MEDGKDKINLGKQLDVLRAEYNTIKHKLIEAFEKRNNQHIKE